LLYFPAGARSNFEMSRYGQLRAVIAGSLLLGLLLALGLAVSPRLHERFHPDTGSATHECAVTLISAGKVEQAGPPPVLCLPQAAQVYETIPGLHSTWVEAPFLGASIFEHAPPALF